MKLNAYIVDFLESPYPRHGVVVLLALCASLIIWSMARHKSDPTPGPAQVVTAMSRLNISSTAEKIATAHMFGLNPVDSASAAPAAVAASITIDGLFYSTDPELARVILEVNGKSEVFKTGDALPDGEKLAAIGMNAVQIADGPALRVVEMDQKFGGASASISLQGVPDLYAGQQGFPALAPTTGMAGPAVPRMRTVSLPQGGDPISQLRALRAQLIPH